MSRGDMGYVERTGRPMEGALGSSSFLASPCGEYDRDLSEKSGEQTPRKRIPTHTHTRVQTSPADRTHTYKHTHKHTVRTEAELRQPHMKPFHVQCYSLINLLLTTLLIISEQESPASSIAFTLHKTKGDITSDIQKAVSLSHVHTDTQTHTHTHTHKHTHPNQHLTISAG